VNSSLYWARVQLTPPVESTSSRENNDNRAQHQLAAKYACPLSLFPVVPPPPVGLDCLVYQFAEAETKLKIKYIFNAVRTVTH
jgi:hypothetical protein